MDRTAPILPIMPGVPEKATHDDVRHGTLFAALEVATGWVEQACLPRHRHQVDKAYPRRGLHLVVDNYATHKHPAGKAWLARNLRITVFRPWAASPGDGYHAAVGRSGWRVVESADHALTLIGVLRRDGVVRVSAVAREMGVAPSTVHRLLQTLMFRGYAVQRPDQTYAPGPALPPNPTHSHWLALANALHPLLEAVNRAVDETVHLIVRDGDSAVFLDSVVSSQALSISSRAGTRLPAERNSGGKILLAQLAPAAIRPLYAPRKDVDVETLLAQLAATRHHGFGFSVAECERGITAISVCVLGRAGTPVAALSVSAPTLRLDRRQALPVLRSMRAAVRAWPEPPSEERIFGATSRGSSAFTSSSVE